VPDDDEQAWLGARDLTFDRDCYESVVNGLLTADWTQGLPEHS